MPRRPTLYCLSEKDRAYAEIILAITYDALRLNRETGVENPKVIPVSALCAMLGDPNINRLKYVLDTLYCNRLVDYELSPNGDTISLELTYQTTRLFDNRMIWNTQKSFELKLPPQLKAGQIWRSPTRWYKVLADHRSKLFVEDSGSGYFKNTFRHGLFCDRRDIIPTVQFLSWIRKSKAVLSELQPDEVSLWIDHLRMSPDGERVLIRPEVKQNPARPPENPINPVATQEAFRFNAGYAWNGYYSVINVKLG